jgi:hypothetical protein
VQHAEEDDSLPGQDSFIDVVCNMVGILIVLVMIVGVKASAGDSEAAVPTTPASLHTSKSPAASTIDELRATEHAAIEAEQEIVKSVGKIKDLAVQSALVEARRQQLAEVKEAVDKEIAERRAKLDEKGQHQFDVQREIAAAEIKLHQLTKEQVSLLSQKADVQQIECVPTPLAKTVTGEEIHARLRHGQLAVVPADELFAEVGRRGADHLRNGLRDRNGAEDVFGPIDGFRMRLSIERFDAPPPSESPLPEPARPTLVMQGVFLPTSDDLGQPVEQALLPDSPFMRALRAKRNAAPAVTIWVYPDSYNELRSLKRAMWEAGVPMAVRPLADGQPIIFSTAGTKSAAQ